MVVAWLYTLPGLVVGALALLVFDHPSPTGLIAGGIGLAALVSPLGMRFAFQGRERMDAIALGSLAGQAMWTLGVLLWVREASDVRWVPALWLAGEISRVSLMLWLFGARFGRLQPTRWRAVRAWAVASAPVSVGRVARGLVYFMDVLVLGLLVPLSTVGLYAVGLRLPLFLFGLAVLAHRALFPLFSRVIRTRGPQGTAALVGLLLPPLLSPILAAAVTLAVSGHAFLGVLFGPAYAEAAPWMAVLLFRAPLASVGGLCRMVLWVEAPDVEARAAVLGTLVNVVLLLGAAAAFGPMGAAVAMLAGEAVLVALYMARSTAHLRDVALPRSWMALQAAGLLICAAWAPWVSGQPEWMTMGSAFVVGAVAGFGPLLPQLPRLVSELRR